MKAAEYHKIHNVWARNPEDKYKTLLEGQWAKPEFDYLANCDWQFTEKVDGMNIRIELAGGTVSIAGRTNNANLRPALADRLQAIGADALAVGVDDLVLYGEGYGARIQPGGGNYRPDGVDFVLFDVWCGMWLRREDVAGIGAKIGVDVVPLVGRGTLHDAIMLTREGFDSQWGAFAAEGVICRPVVELVNRQGERIITKIKTKDFS